MKRIGAALALVVSVSTPASAFFPVPSDFPAPALLQRYCSASDYKIYSPFWKMIQATKEYTWQIQKVKLHLHRVLSYQCYDALLHPKQFGLPTREKPTPPRTAFRPSPQLLPPPRPSDTYFDPNTNTVVAPGAGGCNATGCYVSH